MDRKSFIKKNLTGFALAGFVAHWGSIEQIRNYMQQEKPLLTEKNLNRFFANATRNKEMSRHIPEMTENLPRFLENNFSLSPTQQDLIKNFSAEDLKQFNELLSEALKEEKTLSVKFGGQKLGQCQKTKVVLAAQRGTITVSI